MTEKDNKGDKEYEPINPLSKWSNINVLKTSLWQMGTKQIRQ